jgi:hypothetical protein
MDRSPTAGLSYAPPGQLTSACRLPRAAWMALRRLAWIPAVREGLKVSDRIVRMAQEQAGRSLRSAQWRAELTAAVLATWPADPDKRTRDEWDAVRTAAPAGGHLPSSVIRGRTRQIAAFARKHGRMLANVFELEAAPPAARMLLLAACDRQQATIERYENDPRAGAATAVAARPARPRSYRRAVFYNALGYAVEQGLLGANPVDRIQWRAPEVAETVDRRVVASPAQAQLLLAAVRAQGPRGQHLEAFFGCVYYARHAALGGGVAAGRRLSPARPGWAALTWLPPSHVPGAARPTTAPPTKPAASSTAPSTRCGRSPSRPTWSRCCAPTSSGTAPARTGRLFRTARDGAIQESAYGAIWRAARTAAFTGAQQASPLARRAYDLRHAAVSLWLNAGVPATEVAPRPAQRRRPAQGLRPLHRRPGRRRQPAHHRRPHHPR